MTVKERYEAAREMYKSMGVDTDRALEALRGIPVSMHCWQGDDVVGFDGAVISVIPTLVKPDIDIGLCFFSICLLRSTNFFDFPSSPIIVFIFSPFSVFLLFSYYTIFFYKMEDVFI